MYIYTLNEINDNNYKVIKHAFRRLVCWTKLFGMKERFACKDLLFLLAKQVFFWYRLVLNTSQDIVLSFEQTVSFRIVEPLFSQVHRTYEERKGLSWVTFSSGISSKLSASSTLWKEKLIFLETCIKIHVIICSTYIQYSSRNDKFISQINFQNISKRFFGNIIHGPQSLTKWREKLSLKII